MAIFHARMQVIGRSTGRSAVAAAAYRAAELLHDERQRRFYDFTAKAGVVHSGVMLPPGAPERWRDRATLWNEVEATEKRKDAQLARELEFSLPRELSQAEAIGLACDFVAEQFVSRGMVADVNVHWTTAKDGDAQPHAHVMLTMRQIEKGQQGEGRFGPKAREWNSRELYEGVREQWAALANERLAEQGHDVRIDHRSYAEQGIPLEPQGKIGPAGARRAVRGEDAERAAEHDAIARRNGERIAADPAVALDALTRQHSTFTRQDLARFVNRHSDGAEQFGFVMARVEASPELVRLGVDGRGRERFSTQEMVAAEQRMEGAAAELGGDRRHQVLAPMTFKALDAAERRGMALGAEQRDAVHHVTREGGLALVVGYAGTGKSAMLGVAREAWEAAGFRVRGAALSGIAAEGLEGGSGIESRTLASLEYGWKEGRDELTRRDVLVVDEAGMVGSRQMERVLSAARAAGAKVVLVGDPEQLQAIEAGAAFRALAERHGAAEIGEVRRQREGWQREATRELATGRTVEALGRYERAGMVVGHGTAAEARASLVEGWDQERRAAPAAAQMILAYTRADVAALNALARERLGQAGELGQDQMVQTERGERVMASGDRLMFLRNERALGAGPGGQGGAAVKNGTLGTVLAVDSKGERLTVRLDGPGGPAGAGQEGRDSRPVVTFYLRDYGHVDHGYAATIHKAQGVTVDRAHVLASAHMDRHAAYVALTRHRDGVALHYGRDEFADGRALARMLGRERAKDVTLDYGQAFAERRGLDPLRPESEIVVRQRVPVPEAPATAEPAQATPRRGRFAGLRLGSGGGASRPVPELASMPVPQPEPAPVDTLAARLRQGLAGYAQAWADAARMERAGLPVLAHQEAALVQAGVVLDREGVGMARDAAAVLLRDPSLAGRAAGGQVEGVALFGRAVGEARQSRQVLDERGRDAVRGWDALEREYEAAGKAYEWDAQRAVGTRMERFAQALKQAPELDQVLRERGRELGIVEGSRLDQVVRAPEVDWRLMRRLDLGHGPRMRSGPSMGM